MAVIQDLVLTFCPTMHSVQQRKLKLLMLVYFTLILHLRFSQDLSLKGLIYTNKPIVHTVSIPASPHISLSN